MESHNERVPVTQETKHQYVCKRSSSVGCISCIGYVPDESIRRLSG